MDIVFASQHHEHPEAWVQALEAALPGESVRLWDDPRRPPGTAQVAVVWSPPAALFSREPRLQYLFNLGAGVDALLQMPELPDDLRIIRLEDAGMAHQMAEYAVHYLVRESRGFDYYARQQSRARWHRLEATQREQWPVGVLGAGRIGAHVAQVFVLLGYPVAVWSRSGRAVPGADAYGGRQGLPRFLERTRALINILPLTDETRGILCRQTFARLLPDACVINMARGGHLVDADLIEALDSGRLRRAVLDAFTDEPLPAEHPFWRHPRIDVTPHVAGMSLMAQTVEQVAGKIRALKRGEPFSGLVDRTQQY